MLCDQWSWNQLQCSVHQLLQRKHVLHQYTTAMAFVCITGQGAHGAGKEAGHGEAGEGEEEGRGGAGEGCRETEAAADQGSQEGS